MKIQSYELKGDMIKVHTNMGDFVYFNDKFGSKAELEAEILKRIALDDDKKSKKTAKLNKLTVELKEK